MCVCVCVSYDLLTSYVIQHIILFILLSFLVIASDSWL